MTTNGFLKDYNERIEKMNYTLEQSIHRGSFDTELDLKEVMGLFKGLVQEIKAMQMKNDALTEALRNKND